MKWKKNGCINTRLSYWALPVSVTIFILLQEGFALKTSPRNLRGKKLKVLWPHTVYMLSLNLLPQQPIGLVMIPNLQRQKLRPWEACSATRAWSQDSRPVKLFECSVQQPCSGHLLATGTDHYGLSTASAWPAGEVSPAQLSIGVWL